MHSAFTKWWESGRRDAQRLITFRRNFAMVVLAYRGLLRGDEVVNIQADEFDFGPIPATADEIKSRCYPPEIVKAEFVFLSINSSKTDPQKQRPVEHRHSKVVVIGYDSDARLDPAVVLREWLKSRDESASHLFHAIGSHTPISRSVYSEAVKSLATNADISERLTGHSSRAGGATDAVRATDLRLVQKHGRWKSDAVLLYVRDSNHASIAVSIALGAGSATNTATSIHIKTAPVSSFHRLPPPRVGPISKRS